MRGAVALLVAVVASGAACSRGPAPAPGVATRVVSLGPSTTEALFAIGAGDKVVGRSRYCNFPPEATKLPAVGGLEPDLEAILGLRPDLVVGPSGAWSTPFAKTLADRGISTWFPAEIATLGGIDALLLALGDRTGTRTGAERAVASIHAQERAVDRAVSGLPRPRALLVVGLDPIVVAGPASFGHDLLLHAGSLDAETDPGAWPVVSFERLVELDPDVVLDSAEGDTPGPSRIGPQSPGWSGVRAVREGHVIVLHDDRVLLPGPRIGEGLTVLAHALHPEAVP
jgi:iron complex transport system substrate-binding protein